MNFSTLPSNLKPPPPQIIDTHKVYSIAIACAILGILGVVAVSGRLWYRIRSKTFGMDDYFIVPAFVLYLGWSVLCVYGPLATGTGKPLHEITVEEFTILFQSIIAISFLYPVMSGAIRISILLFYNRVFASGSGKLFNRCLRVVTWIQVPYILAFSIAPGFICRPFNVAWNPIERGPFCSYFYWNAVIISLYSLSFLFDLALLILPIIPVLKLQMPLQRRVGVTVMFLLGASASVASVYKLAIYLVELDRTNTADPVWFEYMLSQVIPVQFDDYGVTVWIPCQLEPTSALIGSSLPAIYRLLKMTYKNLNEGRSRDIFGRRRDFDQLDEPPTQLRPMNIINRSTIVKAFA
ncbi:hypothetical protein F4859DRAFT_516613 [Xylaria cf. heliscus]|nr:hypothetical protein F4859DRAFT_516613 [Xylaria cf. heliscus]